jgi:TonB family protein
MKPDGITLSSLANVIGRAPRATSHSLCCRRCLHCGSRANLRADNKKAMPFLAIRLGLAAALTVSLAAHAQPAPAASSVAPNERAQRDADKVFQMILQHADKPRRAPVAAEPRAPATPAAARPAAPPAAATAPTRAADARVTASTPPAVPAEPAKQVQPDGGSSSGPSVPDMAAAPEAVSTPSLGSAAAAVPVAVLAPVSVAAPRSLKLELVSSVEPEFPARLVRSLGKGSVTVNFEVQPDGRVGRTEVTSSSHRGLNEAAQAAVAAWRFKPISETMPGVVELKFE